MTDIGDICIEMFKFEVYLYLVYILHWIKFLIYRNLFEVYLQWYPVVLHGNDWYRWHSLKCSNSKCICQTLFGAYIVLNDWSLKLVSMIYSRWINWNGYNYMKLSYFERTLPYKVWLCSVHDNEYIFRKLRNIFNTYLQWHMVFLH